ncbi:glycosyltransferase family 39 protein [Candidatus Saccharibacteria bacterium]|nr:glycosyltransferase family 39 protein [Candidatus Saccharibacteria bacterium]
MKSDLVQQITLYKYRYIAGFGVLFLLLFVVVIWQFWTLPDGLSAGEMTAATAAGHFSFSKVFSETVNLPWTILEWLSIKILGASTFAFRLPAVILMILSAGGLILLLKKWSRDNIAVISGFLTVTSVLFISLSRSGTPAVMTTFLVVMILLSALTIIRSIERFGEDNEKNQTRRTWRTLLAKITLSVALALLCYQAAGVYLVAMFVVMGVLHPKTRLIFIKSKLWKIIVGALTGLVVMTPLVLGFITGGLVVVKQWLMVDGTWSWGQLSTNLSTMFGLEIGFVGGFITPVVTLVSLIIVLLGLMKTITDFFSARSYLVLPFLVITLTLAVWRVELVYLLFVPLTLLTAVGIETLVHEWYSLFPRNPYARLLAVVILTALVFGLVWAQLARFSLSQNYDVSVIDSYNQEYSAARTVISQEKDAVTLVVRPDQQKLYQILQYEFPFLTVTTESKKDSRNIILDSARINSADIPTKIITNSHSKNAVLLRIY